jgi:hypothetical protein
MEGEPPEKADEPSGTPRSALRGALATWPRRIGALVGSALLAWAVSQFAPALWEETSERAGIAPGSLQVEVVTDPDLIETLDPLHNPEFLLERPIAEVGPPPNGEEERGRYRWAKEMEGVDAFATVLRLVIRGRGEAPVTLHGLEVEVVERRPPLPGTVLTYDGQGAGQVVRFFEIDLDAKPPVATYSGAQGGEETLFPYRVSAGELEVFDIYAFTFESDVRWRLRLAYTDDEETGALVIDNHGQPFETSATSTAEHRVEGQRAYYWAQSGVWAEAIRE